MKSYNVKDLQLLSSKYNFIRDNLEKVLRLSEILKYVSTSNTLNDCLVLKGGTAINLIFSEFPRLSVDLDYDFCANTDRAGVGG